MALTRTDDFPVKELYYYLLDFRRFMYPVLMPVHFVNRNAAKRILKANIPNRNTQKKFSIIKGKSIKHERIPYKIGDGNYFHRGSKYIYPGTLGTKQDRKSFRTLMRRRIRRMGLLTRNQKIKFRYNEKVKAVKPRENHQRVAKSPNTDAKVFQLDRKPKRYYYIILKKRLSTKRGKLFKIRCIRVNIKTGVFKKIILHTFRNDIFIPELLNNLKKIPNAKGAIEEYYKEQQKEVLR